MPCKWSESRSGRPGSCSKIYLSQYFDSTGSRSGLQKRKILSPPKICPLFSSKHSLIVLPVYWKTVLSIVWITESFNVGATRAAMRRQRLTCLQAVQLTSGILPNVPRCDIQYNHIHSMNNWLVRTSSWLFSSVVLRVACEVTTVEERWLAQGWQVVPGVRTATLVTVEAGGINVEDLPSCRCSLDQAVFLFHQGHPL